MLLKNTTIQTFLYAITIFHFCSILSAQPIGIRSEFYSLNDGLSNRQVHTMKYVDPGFLWLGTPAGLNRFDGNEFTVFNNRQSNTKKITEINIHKILVDQQNRLVLTYYGQPALIDILDPNSFELKTIKLTPTSGLKGVPRTVFSSKDNRIFILTLAKDGIRIFELAVDGTYKQIFHHREERKSLTVVVDAINLSDGSFFINDKQEGLRWFTQLGKLIKKIGPQQLNLNNKDIYPSRSYILHEDNKGDVWFSFAKVAGLFKWQPLQEEIKREQNLSQQHLYSGIWEDQQGNLLFAQTNGVGFFPEAKGLFCYDHQQQWHDFSFLITPSIKIINIATPDNFFESIFLGMDTGLKVVKNKRSKVRTLLSKNIKEYERGAVMRGIEEDENGNIYIAREVNYWYKWDPNNEQLDTITLIDSLTNRRIQFNCGMNLRYDAARKVIWGIICNEDDQGLLVKFFPNSNKVLTYSYPFKFSDLAIAPDSTIWLIYTSQYGTSGLISFKQETATFEDYLENGENLLNNTYPRFLQIDRKGLLWIGSDNGLFQIDTYNKKSKNFTKEANGLSSNTIYEIQEDPEGKIWLGTTDGINIFDPISETSVVYTRADGLPDNTICGIVPDFDNNYWIATYDGISHFNTKNKTFKNFFRRDGLSHNEFNRFSYHQASDGLLYFGGVNGVNIFDPIELLNDSTSANILITRYTEFDRLRDTIIVKEDQLDQKSRFEISPYISYFQFDFGLNNFEISKNNRYSIWLEGYEKGYSYIGKNNTIRYYKLPPGSYTLYIRGSNVGGTWSVPKSVKIIVHQIFYKQLWFVVLSILFVAGLVYLIFKALLNQKIKLERLRTKISSDLHDEVSGLLAGIAIQSDVLRLKAKNDLNKEKLGLIGDVSRKAITKMSDVIWSIDSRNDKMEDLLQRMKDHLVEVLTPKEIKYYINVKKINTKAKIPVNIRQDLYLLFKEAINNIAKHSNASEVSIKLYNENKHFRMIIQDNGSDQQTDHLNHKSPKKGQGLSNMRMRAHRLGSKLIITNQKGYTINLTMKRFS